MWNTKECLCLLTPQSECPDKPFSSDAQPERYVEGEWTMRPESRAVRRATSKHGVGAQLGLGGGWVGAGPPAWRLKKCRGQGHSAGRTKSRDRKKPTPARGRA